jgi:hypothetical protein
MEETTALTVVGAVIVLVAIHSLWALSLVVNAT